MMTSRRRTVQAGLGLGGGGGSGDSLGEPTAKPATRRGPSEQRLRRGSASQTEYLNAAIFMRASAATKQRLARANQFDVVGGVSQAEIDILGNIAPGDRA